MCDPKKCFASWVAALVVRVESHPLRYFFESSAKNSEAFCICSLYINFIMFVMNDIGYSLRYFYNLIRRERCFESDINYDAIV